MSLKPQVVNRRWFLAALAPGAFVVSCGTRPPKVIRAAHAVGLCNMPMFIMAERKTAEPFGVTVELVDIPNWGDHPVALTSKGIDVSITPFTTVLNAYAQGLPLRIISGSGLNGLYLLGQKGITSISALKGKKIGTFRADTLEVAAYDAIRKAGLERRQFEMVYFNSGTELMNAFANRSVDAMTHVEPYATQAIRQFGAQVLSTGQDVWGGTHPDCVLTTTEEAIRTKRAELKAIIAGMFKAEAMIEGDFAGAVETCNRKYYKAIKEDILLAGKSQPPGVDIRDKKDFILDRSRSLQELGYIQKPVDTMLVDFSLLNDVIAERPELLEAVRVKSSSR